MKWTEILTAIVALYGAILATITFVNQWRNAKPRVSVGIQQSVIIMGSGSCSEPVITVTPKNYGQKKVTLSNMGFLLPDKKILGVPLPLGPVRLPYELEPEANCTMWVEEKEFAKSILSQGMTGRVKIVGYVVDAVGRQYKSKSLEFNVDPFLSEQPGKQT